MAACPGECHKHALLWCFWRGPNTKLKTEQDVAYFKEFLTDIRSYLVLSRTFLSISCLRVFEWRQNKRIYSYIDVIRICLVGQLIHLGYHPKCNITTYIMPQSSPSQYIILLTSLQCITCDSKYFYVTFLGITQSLQIHTNIATEPLSETGTHQKVAKAERNCETINSSQSREKL